MGTRGSDSIRPFRRAIDRWKFVGGGIDEWGNPVVEPAELVEAKIIDGIARRYGMPPSAVLLEDVSLLKHIAIIKLGETSE
jgi:hypothetical protein